MSTQAERIVRVESEDGRRRYAMSEAAFKHAKQPHLGGGTYEEAGYKIVSYEDGTEYGGSNEPTKYGLHAAALSPEIGAEPEAQTAPTPTRSRATPVAGESGTETSSADASMTGTGGNASA